MAAAALTAAAAAAALGAGGTAYAATDQPPDPCRVLFVTSFDAKSLTEHNTNTDRDTRPTPTIAGLPEPAAIALAG